MTRSIRAIELYSECTRLLKEEIRSLVLDKKVSDTMVATVLAMATMEASAISRLKLAD